MRFDCGASESVVKSGILRRDPIEGVGRGLGIDGGDHDGVGAGGDEVVHQRVLQRRSPLGGIAELGLIAVAELGLRLLDPGFGKLPEIGGGVDDECHLLRFLRLRRGARQRQRGGDGRHDDTLHSDPPVVSMLRFLLRRGLPTPPLERRSRPC